MARETWVQSQVESYQRLKKWYLMPPCLTLSIIRYGTRVKWSNPGKGVAPSPTPWCSKLSKREPSGHPRLWSPTLLTLYIYIYIYIKLFLLNLFICLPWCVTLKRSVVFLLKIFSCSNQINFQQSQQIKKKKKKDSLLKFLQKFAFQNKLTDLFLILNNPNFLKQSFLKNTCLICLPTDSYVNNTDKQSCIKTKIIITSPS